MTIPKYEQIMLPILIFSKDQKEHSVTELYEYIFKYFKLTLEEQKERLPSGSQPIIENRVGWARTYLKKAGLLESKRRAFINITKRGLDVLKSNPESIDQKYLEKFPEFLEFKSIHRDHSNQEQEHEGNQTPQESLEYGYQNIRKNLSQELINTVKQCSPNFFEKLVVDLLLKMGYGGSLKDAGKAIGQSGDGGIDGIIKEDKLGLDIIYIQAKRWEGSVGRPEIHKFVGALQGQRARKGIFITTSTFSKDALDYVAMIDTKIILIDGEQLAQLMIDYDIGVSKIAIYEIKKIDSDYFIEE